MRKHESGCTLNPHRTCGVCRNPVPDVAGLASVALKGDIQALLSAADGCPACALAAIRQADWPMETFIDDYGLHPVTAKHVPLEIRNWSFRDALDGWWREWNAGVAANHD